MKINNFMTRGKIPKTYGRFRNETLLLFNQLYSKVFLIITGKPNQ
jgi:hypothetical protein